MIVSSFEKVSYKYITTIKEIEIIYRLFLVIAMYCQASSSQFTTQVWTVISGKFFWRLNIFWDLAAPTNDLVRPM